MAYRVRAGDTLELVADRFDVTPYQIRQWNHLGTSSFLPGRTLKVYVGGRSGGQRRIQHRAGSAPKTAAKKKTPGRKAPTTAGPPKADAKSAALSATAGK